MDTDRDIWFPPLIDYVLSRRCPTCGAAPWTDCAAPRKQGRRARTNALLEAAGMEPISGKRVNLQHAARQDAGTGHRIRDIGRAPWVEDRVPGTSYGTVNYAGRS